MKQLNLRNNWIVGARLLCESIGNVLIRDLKNFLKLGIYIRTGDKVYITLIFKPPNGHNGRYTCRVQNDRVLDSW